MRKIDNFKFGFLSNTENCKHACFSVSQGLRSDSFSHWILMNKSILATLSLSTILLTLLQPVKYLFTSYLSCLVNAEYFLVLGFFFQVCVGFLWLFVSFPSAPLFIHLFIYIYIYEELTWDIAVASWLNRCI